MKFQASLEAGFGLAGVLLMSALSLAGALALREEPVGGLGDMHTEAWIVALVSITFLAVVATIAIVALARVGDQYINNGQAGSMGRLGRSKQNRFRQEPGESQDQDQTADQSDEDP